MTAQTMHHSEAQLRAALNDLAARYEAIARKATTEVGRSRAMQILKAADDIRHVLVNGYVPDYLITDSSPRTQPS